MVELGATVTVRNEETGAEHTWTVVKAKRSGVGDEIAADTPVARALLGRPAGETVLVDVAKPWRAKIVRVVAPAVPSPRPRLRDATPDEPIAEFSRGDDAAFEDWARRNGGGYVLINRGARGYMLHSVSCSHIGLDSDYTLRSTSPRKPRLCSRSRAVLERRARDETGEQPAMCGTCFG